MMYEKISESHQRIEKINRLRTKILSEIEYQSKRIEDAMKDYLNKGVSNSEYWQHMVSLEFALLKLKGFVEEDDLFQSYVAKYNEQDTVIYHVSDKMLDIWLQDSYNFVIKYLCKVEYDEEFTNIDMTLNDKYFGHEFTDMFDEILYDQKQAN